MATILGKALCSFFASVSCLGYNPNAVYSDAIELLAERFSSRVFNEAIILCQPRFTEGRFYADKLCDFLKDQGNAYCLEQLEYVLDDLRESPNLELCEDANFLSRILDHEIADHNKREVFCHSDQPAFLDLLSQIESVMDDYLLSFGDDVPALASRCKRNISMRLHTLSAYVPHDSVHSMEDERIEYKKRFDAWIGDIRSAPVLTV